MYSRKIVPPDFIVPEKIEKSEFILKPLTVRDIIKDYDAVMSSVDHLKGLMDDSGWPEGLTIEENLIDLGWHQREFTEKHSFAYTILSPNNHECIGCCYIYPSENKEFEVQAFYWIRQNMLSDGLEERFGNFFKDWIKNDWPFKSAEFPGRD